MPRLNRDITFYLIILALSIFSILYSFSIVGSPSYRKSKAYDKVRYDQLNNLSYKVKNFYSTSRYLPETSESIPTFATVTDPQTSQIYTYERLSNDSFNLCATFATAQDKKHKQGYDCIKYSVNNY